MSSLTSKFFLLGLFAVVFLTPGCQKGPYPVVKLEGTIKYDGQLLENVELTFTPEEGRASSAFVLNDGRFKAKYSPSVMGVQSGNLRVNVIPLVNNEPGKPPTALSEVHKEVKEKYGYGQPGFPIEVTKANSSFVIDLPKTVPPGN
ncbi:MAG: hypothetical protein FWH27_03305 [Planctomycetaceae bacterium]|nr:hypothetical protein [Planctomycetaceae bacterium]